MAKRFRSLPPALSFFRDTEASAFKRLISALAYSRLFSISLASEAGDSSPSSSEGVKTGGEVWGRAYTRLYSSPICARAVASSSAYRDDSLRSR